MKEVTSVRAKLIMITVTMVDRDGKIISAREKIVLAGVTDL